MSLPWIALNLCSVQSIPGLLVYGEFDSTPTHLSLPTPFSSVSLGYSFLAIIAHRQALSGVSAINNVLLKAYDEATDSRCTG